MKKNIKVSGFYLKPLNDIKLYFEKLSKQTKGITKCIDIYEKNSSAIMTQFIVERALKLIGGESGDGLNGDALVAEYKSILSKRMGR